MRDIEDIQESSILSFGGTQQAVRSISWIEIDREHKRKDVRTTLLVVRRSEPPSARLLYKPRSDLWVSVALLLNFFP